MSILRRSKTYKPFSYPWAVDKSRDHSRMHWHETEIELGSDIAQWNTVARTKYDDGLLPEEKHQISQIFKLFVQSDVQVAGNYADVFIPLLKNNEIRLMLLEFAAREAVHVRSYAMLNDTLGLPESEYWAFLEVEALREKSEFMSAERYPIDFSKGEEAYRNLALALAQTTLTEGVCLFSAFAMLFNFARHGKMKGMGKIVEMSIKDEDDHAQSMARVFRTFIEDEHPELIDDEFKREIYTMFREAVALEDRVIDTAFELGNPPGITKHEMYEFIRYMADRRLIALGLKPNWNVPRNPLPWVEELIGAVKMTNFFENRSVEYTKGNNTAATSHDSNDSYF